jgi:serine/threonine-protein kinase
LPESVAISPSGLIYFSDIGNYRIRKIDSQGIITTVAGTGVPGTSGDGGPAVNVRLSLVEDISYAPDRSLYLADDRFQPHSPNPSEWKHRVRLF